MQEYPARCTFVQIYVKLVGCGKPSSVTVAFIAAVTVPEDNHTDCFLPASTDGG